MKSITKLSAILCLLSSTTLANDLSTSSSRPDYHAPIGVMRDHVHKKGEFMTSYRVGYMKMRGLKDGTDRVSTNQALESYKATPTEMTMQMDMFGLMYGVTDKFTVSAMGSFIEKSMNHENRAGATFKRESDGLGDSKISALYEAFNSNSNRMQFNLGFSLPTGSISQSHQNDRLPYSMQIGSGSFELLPGISYAGYQESYSYGAQANAILRLNSNHYNYKLGDSYNLTSWVAKKLNNSFSLSTRLDYTKSEAIEGVDAALNPTMIATANGSIQDGEKLDLALGINFLTTSGKLKGHRLALEISRPIHQRTDGPLLENGYKAIAGWQLVF